MSILIERNISDLVAIFESIGYKHLDKYDTDDGNGTLERYLSKQVDGGRMHVCCESIDALNTRVNIHYDKFKGHKENSYHHATYYVHPFVTREEKLIREALINK